MESDSSVEFSKSSMFDASVANIFKKFPQIQEKVSAFIASKNSNPVMPFGAKDKPFSGDGPIGRAFPKMRYTHLGHDAILFYTIEGRNPTTIKLYGIFNHDEIGIGQPSNINKQKNFITKLKNTP